MKGRKEGRKERKGGKKGKEDIGTNERKEERKRGKNFRNLIFVRILCVQPVVVAIGVYLVAEENERREGRKDGKKEKKVKKEEGR